MDKVSQNQLIAWFTESMSFSFFKPSRPKTPQELAKAIKDSLMALDTKTVAEVKALEKVPLFYCLLIIIFMSLFSDNCMFHYEIVIFSAALFLKKINLLMVFFGVLYTATIMIILLSCLFSLWGINY